MSEEQKTSDADYAARFVHMNAETVRYVPERDLWFVWNGTTWQADVNGMIVQERALQISSSYTIIRKMIALARSSVVVHPIEFDADPWLLNTASGVVALDDRWNELDPEYAVQVNEYYDAFTDIHKPGYYMTDITKKGWAPFEDAPMWEEFLNKVQPDPEVQEYLQRWAGYMLYGGIRQEEMLVLLGDGANGKSVFMSVLGGVLGSYAISAQPALLIEKHFDAHLEELASTAGKRLVVVSETPHNVKLNEARLKNLTSNEPLSARFMRENSWQFKPTAKLVMMTNHRPVVQGTDEGIWRRIRIVPWNVTIPQEERDYDLARKIIDHEGEQVLAWMHAGFQRYISGGLAMPDVLVEYQINYRAESDVIGQFLEEGGYETGDTSTLSVPTSVLYADLDRYCKEAGLKPPTRLDRKKALVNKGFIYRKSNGQVLVGGLCKLDHSWSV